MSYLDKYKIRDTMYGENLRDIYIQNNRRLLSATFKDSPNYYAVTINDSSDLIDVHIIDVSETKDHKIITYLYDTNLKRGDIVNWKNDKWILFYYDEFSEIYKRSRIAKCPSSLRWLNENGQIVEAWFTLKTDVSTILGIEDGRVISLPQERRNIIISKNVDTEKIIKGKRFIFDNRAWVVKSINGLNDGLIELILEESQLSEYDNKELRIADYHNNLPSYSISILNGNFISIRQDEQLQIQVEVKNKDIVIDNPIVIYSVSDESIAMIDENGLLSPISQGQVIVTAIFENVSATLTVVIEDVVQENKTVEILGSSEIKFGQTLTYTCIFKNNGIPYDDEGIFSITADDGVSPTTLASITSQVNNSCTIKAGSKAGYVRLHVVNGDGTVSNSLRIQVKSLI